MKAFLKKSIALALTLLMLLTSIPVLNLVGVDVGTTAEAATYEVGDLVSFGSYPQSKVTDSATITALNSLAPAWDSWTSYGYYTGTGSIGTMTQGDWMRYTDVTYNGSKYRAVKFTQYRPYYTLYSSSASNSYQDANSYYTNTVYWFKFEPIDWRVLDPATGLVMCETIIDSQPYSNTIYYNSGASDSRYAYFNDASYTNYASDYETSSIRQWLNNDFYNTAFTDSEKNEINTTTLNNDGYYTSVGTTGYEALDSNSTNDKIFLLSYNEVRNNNFGFSSSASTYDTARQAQGSDYAKSQGLWVSTSSSYYGNSYWLLRSPGGHSFYSCHVDDRGHSGHLYGVGDSIIGVRPALRFNRISGISQSENLKSEWFEKGAYNGYNHELAQFCSDIVLLGYKYDESSVTEGLEEVGLTVQSIDMSAKRDEVNYFIADKSIGINGTDKNLIVIGCIGSYKDQWYSNFDPLSWESDNNYAGTSEYLQTHLGFASARDFVYGKLNEYIKTKNIDKSNSIILLTGHSRGSATVNLLAAKLIDNSSSFGVSTNDIYTYGFATPNTTTNSNSSRYYSIINIVNPEDFVTKVLPSSWSFRRYGVTYTLPSKTNDSAYSKYLQNLQKQFAEYEPYKKGEKTVYNLLEDMSDSLSGLKDFYTKIDVYTFKTTFEYFRNRILPFVAGDSNWTDYVGAAGTMLKFFTFQQKLTAFFLSHQVLRADFEKSHLMDTYDAFLDTMTAEQVKTIRKGYKGSVNCPVDVEIYDKETGELVGRIVDNVVDEEIEAKENSVVMDVEGDSKTFWLPSNGDYEIVLIGNDEGTMDYTMSEIDSDLGETERVNFFDVEITDGLTMTAGVLSEDFEIEKHELTYENGETLEPTEILTEDEIMTYSIDVTTTAGGVASSSQTATSGDYVSLIAQPSEGWSLVGWYENDELISEESTLAFVVKSDRNLEAKFEHIDHTLGNWYTVTPATCETSGVEQRDCSECDYYETQDIPATGHNFDGSKCTACGYDKADDCSCRCHKDNFFAKLIWNIINFFNKILRRDEICACGRDHW